MKTRMLLASTPLMPKGSRYTAKVGEKVTMKHKCCLLEPKMLVSRTTARKPSKPKTPNFALELETCRAQRHRMGMRHSKHRRREGRKFDSSGVMEVKNAQNAAFVITKLKRQVPEKPGTPPWPGLSGEILAMAREFIFDVASARY